MTQFAELIERLREATGADRELDARIFWLTMSDDTRALFDGTGYIAKVVTREWDAGKIFGLFYNSSDKPPDRFDQAPRYSASIDAALTLVPEGWTLANLSNQRESDFWFAELREGYLTSYNRVVITETRSDHARPKTPALALCIAALKAREVNSAAR